MSAAEPRTVKPTVFEFDLGHFFNTDIAFFSITGHDGYFKRSNSAFEEVLGWSETELLAKSFYELIHPDDIPVALSNLVEVERSGRDVAFDVRFLHKDGRYRWLAWVVQGEALSNAWYATARDITPRKELLEALEEVQERLRMAMSMAESGSWEYVLTDDRLTLDASAQTVLNIPPGTFGGHLADLLALTPAEDHDQVQQLRTAPEPIELHFRVTAADGSTRHIALRGKVVERDRRGRPQRAVGIAWNVTSQKHLEQQLLDLSLNDQLTGLKNRRAFDENLHAEWERCCVSGETLAVLLFDIDDFKQVNDTFGHQVGDRYLTAIARALASVLLRPGDFVARYGGEEFMAFLPGCGPDDVGTVADRFVSAVRALRLAHPDGKSVVTISAGACSVRPVTGIALDDAIRAADTALYRAKKAGKNQSALQEVA